MERKLASVFFSKKQAVVLLSRVRVTVVQKSRLDLVQSIRVWIYHLDAA